MIVPRHLGLRVWTFPSEATAISTKKGWCPLEMAKFSEGRYEAPQGPVIGGPWWDQNFYQSYISQTSKNFKKLFYLLFLKPFSLEMIISFPFSKVHLDFSGHFVLLKVLLFFLSWSSSSNEYAILFSIGYLTIQESITFYIKFEKINFETKFEYLCKYTPWYTHSGKHFCQTMLFFDLWILLRLYFKSGNMFELKFWFT